MLDRPIPTCQGTFRGVNPLRPPDPDVVHGSGSGLINPLLPCTSACLQSIARRLPVLCPRVLLARRPPRSERVLCSLYPAHNHGEGATELARAMAVRVYELARSSVLRCTRLSLCCDPSCSIEEACMHPHGTGQSVCAGRKRRTQGIFQSGGERTLAKLSRGS